VALGKISLEEARGEIVTRTRQYAKRQLTWFAREPTLTKVMLSGPVSPATLDFLARKPHT
jgi:tRNA A37 N6-isopentenylltransferase MiaA